MPIARYANERFTDAAFLWFLTFQDYSATPVLRAVNDTTEHVGPGGHTYHPFPFEVRLPPDDGQKLQTVEIAFPNVGRELMRLVREYDASLRPRVQIQLAVYPDLQTVEKTIDHLEVGDVSHDALEIRFTLIVNPAVRRRTCLATYSALEFPGIAWALL